MSKKQLLLCGGLCLTLASGLCPAQQDSAKQGSAGAKAGAAEQAKPGLGQRTDGAELLPPELRITRDFDPMPRLEVVTTRKADVDHIDGLLVTTMKPYLLQGYGNLPPNRIRFLGLISGRPGIDRRPVVNKTGFKGSFDFVDFPVAAAGPAGAPAEGDAPSIFTTLEEKFGLKLVSTKGPVEVLVVDSIEEAEN